MRTAENSKGCDRRLRGTWACSLLTSLTSMPLLTDQVVWKHSSMRCSKALGSRWTRMKSFRSLVRMEKIFSESVLADTFPNPTLEPSPPTSDPDTFHWLPLAGKLLTVAGTGVVRAGRK
ncbi:hypothetical protein EYF80_010718 [Liparis tanakae]|uniref:Uncharacterized protein n=1 Tax=Liparis tanakae TaxID=230148 RepID=A0A4Z2ILY2_9TELE|nr:hypothetical protein EYF80_010718 [Liparis tanakae]